MCRCIIVTDTVSWSSCHCKRITNTNVEQFLISTLLRYASIILYDKMEQVGNGKW